MKQLLFLMLIATTGHAQINWGINIGNNVGTELGYIYKNIDVRLVGSITYNSTTKPRIGGLTIGKEFLALTNGNWKYYVVPQIGYVATFYKNFDRYTEKYNYFIQDVRENKLLYKFEFLARKDKGGITISSYFCIYSFYSLGYKYYL